MEMAISKPPIVGVPAFFWWALGCFLSNILSNLKFAEPIDDERADDESGEQRRQTGERRPKGQIAKDAKRRKIVKQLLVQQPIKQSASVSSFVVRRWPHRRLPTGD